MQGDDQAIKSTVCDCHKVSYTHHKLLLNQEMDHTNFADVVLNTIQNVQLFHMELTYQDSSPC